MSLFDGLSQDSDQRFVAGSPSHEQVVIFAENNLSRLGRLMMSNDWTGLGGAHYSLREGQHIISRQLQTRLCIKTAWVE